MEDLLGDTISGLVVASLVGFDEYTALSFGIVADISNRDMDIMSFDNNFQLLVLTHIDFR